MPTRILLSAGDDLADSIDLMHVDGDNGAFVELDGFSAPTPKESDAERTVKLTLLIRATNATALAFQKSAIERLLALADRSSGAPGGAWMGAPVVLAVSWLDNPTILYFDLKRPAAGGRCGTLEEKNRDFGPYALQRWTLSLTAHPLLRGDPQLYPPDGPVTVTNGLAGFVFLPDIPGDADALCQVTLADVSTGTAVVNGVHLARRSLPGMQAGDCVPVLKCSPRSPGAWAADPTALGGVHVARLQVNAAWRPVALLESPGAGLNHGPLDLWVRWRDSSALLDAPFNLLGTPDTSTGSLPPDTYTIVITEINAAGAETIGSDPITVRLSGTGQIALTWAVVGAPVDHGIYYYYFAGAAQEWRRKASGSASGAYTLTTTGGGFPAPPPAAAAAALGGGAVRARVALADATDFSPPGGALRATLGGSRYEYGCLGTWQLPPMHQMEGADAAGWQVLIEARDTGSGAPNIDVDGIWLLPHAQTEPQLVAEVDGQALAARRVWLLEGMRRDGRAAGMLPGGSGVPTIQLSPRGRFTLGPGGNCVIVKLTTQNGVADCTDAKVAASFRRVPRYRDLTAAVA